VSRARRGEAEALDPALFARAVVAGLAAGEAAPGDGAAPVAVDGVAPDGGVSLLQLPDGAYARAAFALKRLFAGDPARFRSAYARFRALMDLFARGVLEPWTRPRGAGRTALHPAVIDVASRMRLSDNGRFAPRKFARAVEETARMHYPDLEGWE